MRQLKQIFCVGVRQKDASVCVCTCKSGSTISSSVVFECSLTVWSRQLHKLAPLRDKTVRAKTLVSADDPS